MCDDGGSKKLGVGTQRRFFSVQVSFACVRNRPSVCAFSKSAATARRMKSISTPYPEADPGNEILVEKEERLNRDHFAVLVLYGEILIVESFPYRIFNEFVVATRASST